VVDAALARSRTAGRSAGPRNNPLSLRLNWLLAPFNNLKVRQAVLYAVNQRDYLSAQIGDDALSEVSSSFYGNGSPYRTEAGAVVKPGLDRAGNATFFVLATGRAGRLNASPGGGPPGFVQAVDPKTLAFADWRGNNRIESLRNLAEDDRLGMLFIFPGLEVFLRINGRGRVTTMPELLQRLTEAEHLPKSAVLFSIDRVIFYCGKAVNRARLWEEASLVEPTTVSSMGQVSAGLNGLVPGQAAAIDARYNDAMRNNPF
jgi:predicted pyridoxine 5'-phosphate oxidase superfamily flavin-nucleotide-binding protein